MANYVLAPEEQVIFELNIEAPSKGDDGVVSFAQNLLKTFLPVCRSGIELPHGLMQLDAAG